MEGIEAVNWELIAPFVLLEFSLTLVALVLCIRQEMTKERRLVWILIIIFINFLGPIIYLLFGRRKKKTGD
ncbi:PLDc N-terminal domain-containing protein [Bacillus daqingensis]|uniref:PLDc N-terminal domain-containing protein n=1 Tax=Bacillus daqingensis TaxID=872396 RepID=A0ABV9NYH6_9BACI